MQKEELKIKTDDLKNELRIQINFYIIKTVFNIINGCLKSTDPDHDFYDLLEISKSSYDKLVNQGTGFEIQNKIQHWHQLTGISTKIFTGDDWFRESGLDYPDLSLYIEDEKKEIRTKLTNVLKNKISDSNLKELINFARFKKNIVKRDTVIKHLGSISKALDAVDLKHLFLLEKKELTDYINHLENHVEICKAARVFVKQKEKLNSQKKKV